MKKFSQIVRKRHSSKPTNACAKRQILFINAGMVTIQKELEENFYTLKIPNQEVWKAYQELTAFYLQTDENLA